MGDATISTGGECAELLGDATCASCWYEFGKMANAEATCDCKW